MAAVMVPAGSVTFAVLDYWCTDGWAAWLVRRISVLTVHHLGKSQSERVVWLCEELEIAYDLKRYDRVPETRLAPKEYKALHPIEAAPVITDGDLTLAESGAIIEYIIAKYGDGRLKVPASDPDFANYLYWFHFVNGTLQPALVRAMVLKRANLPEDHPVMKAAEGRITLALDFVEARLGAVPHLAGTAFSAADIMMMFSLTTIRYFIAFDLSARPNIRSYIARLSTRPSYRRAMAKGDPGMELLLR